MATKAPDPLAEPRLKLKICMAGEGFSGKTSLIRRFVYDDFSDKYVATLGTRVTKKELVTDVEGDEQRVALMVWDIMGNKGVRDLLRESFYKGAQGVLLVCDVTRPETLDALPGWKDAIEGVAGRLPGYVLANKKDLKEQAVVDEEMVASVCDGWEYEYRFTSAKTGEGVEEIFERLTHRILRAP